MRPRSTTLFPASPSRREALKLSIAAAAGLATTHPLLASTKPAAPVSGEPASGSSAKPTLLILGGTAFLGPELVEAAQAKGWTITLFNRGKTRPNLFPDIEKLRGDRDPDKDEGLKALEGRKWDYVIDTSAYFPRMARASAELLAPSVKQYVIISTISVYKKSDKPGADENAELDTTTDTHIESLKDRMDLYGPLKALCEQEVEKALPGRATVIRPGYIVGPGDWSGRFNYWPLRMREASGAEMLVPGTPADPVQMVDVRDLADFCLRCCEQSTTGIMNVNGGREPWKWGEVLEACKRVTRSDAKLVWVPSSFLKEHEKEGDYFPIWLPPEGETAGFHQWSNARALKAGLTFRALDDTITALLAWYDKLNPDQQKRFLTGVSRERELELLSAWKTSNAK